MMPMENDRENMALPSGARPRRLLGQVLLDGEFISHHDLERALERQKRTNEMLGEVLVGMGVLDSADLKAALSVQWELASVKDAIRAGAGVRLLLGELLLTAKRISPEQLESALEEQKWTGEKLGAVLMRRKSITANELQAALAFQENQGGERMSPSPFRLGEILVATGQITRGQLDRALERQKQTPKKIGDLLIESGDIAPHQVAYGLRIQKKLVTAALVAALSMASVAGADAASPAEFGPKSGSATIQVSATVAPLTTLKTIRQQSAITVTERDIARGYVDAPAASRIEIRTNNPHGCMLVVEGLNGPFRESVVRGMEREVQIGPGPSFVPMPHARGAVTMELSYRFFLSGKAKPGTYSWPLTISSQSF
jgi:hypothetical protein